MRYDLELLGESIVYPGHPLVIAFLIVSRYPNLESALKKGKESSSALENSYIPGAGGNVYIALDFLRQCFQIGFPRAYERACGSWANCDNQKVLDPERHRLGVEQADRILTRLIQALATWPEESVDQVVDPS